MYKYVVCDTHDASDEFFNTLEDAQDWADEIDAENREDEYYPKGNFAVIYKLVEVEAYEYDEEGYTVKKRKGVVKND